MIELSIDEAGLNGMERALLALHRDQLPFAMSRALNDCAKAAALSVNRHMAEVFDRPTRFTERAAIAPRALAASKARLVAEVTLRPIQAQYLALEETGGTRTGAMNTRKPSKRVLVPVKIEKDEFGNIPKSLISGFANRASRGERLRRAKASLASSSAEVFIPGSDRRNKAGKSGWFKRGAGGKLSRLTAYVASSNYKPRLGYHAQVEAIVRETWPVALPARLAEAIKSGR